MKKTVYIILILVLLLGMVLAGCSSNPAEGSGTEVSENGEKQETKEEPEESKFGTRKNPVPLGQEVKVGENWNVELIEIVPDAWSIIKKENQFNEQPEEGHQYVMAKFKITYVGEESGTPWVDLTIKYIGNDGNTYDSEYVVIPKALSDIGEQFSGASAEGNVDWSVSKDALEGGTILVEESFSFDDSRVFFEGVK